MSGLPPHFNGKIGLQMERTIVLGKRAGMETNSVLHCTD